MTFAFCLPTEIVLRNFQYLGQNDQEKIKSWKVERQIGTNFVSNFYHKNTAQNGRTPKIFLKYLVQVKNVQIDI